MATRIEQVPALVLAHALRFCDEPTRDRAAQVSHQFADAVTAARLETYSTLPTLIDLAEHGCLKPRAHAVRSLFKRHRPQSVAAAPQALRDLYKNLSLLEKAEKAGIICASTERGVTRLGRCTEGGFGTTTYQDGGRRLGTWHREGLQGYGFVASADGVLCEGEFKLNELDGQGLCVKPDGTRMQGAWRKDLLHGEAICVWPDGERHEGTWQDHKRHGAGRLLNNDGKLTLGTWSRGRLEGEIRQTWPSGETFRGIYRQGKRDGLGVSVGADGTRRVGYWDGDAYSPTPHGQP